MVEEICFEIEMFGGRGRSLAQSLLFNCFEQLGEIVMSLDIAALRRWLGSGTDLSKIWTEGYHAAKAGSPEDANPYGTISDGLIWLDGWSLYQSCPSLLD